MTSILGKDVDLWIGWDDGWGSYVSAEANGHKIMQSVGLGHYTFEFLGPVAKNGAIIGTVFDAVIGREHIHVWYSYEPHDL